MNIRIEKKKLKQKLEFVEQENKALKEALDVTRKREMFSSKRLITRTLCARCLETYDCHDARDEKYLEYTKEHLAHMLQRELVQYMTIERHADHCGLYPRYVYEGRITVVEPDPSYQREQLCRWVDEGKFDRTHDISPDELRDMLKAAEVNGFHV